MISKDLNVGDYIKIKSSEDSYLDNWLEEQEEKGIFKHKITEIDMENCVFWVENCDYSIWFSDNFVKESE